MQSRYALSSLINFLQQLSPLSFPQENVAKNISMQITLHSRKQDEVLRIWKSDIFVGIQLNLTVSWSFETILKRFYNYNCSSFPAQMQVEGNDLHICWENLAWWEFALMEFTFIVATYKKRINFMYSGSHLMLSLLLLSFDKYD